MVSNKTFIVQELEQLSEEQLKQVADFIGVVKFRDRHKQGTEAQIEKPDNEAEENRQLVEDGLGEHTEALGKEDLNDI